MNFHRNKSIIGSHDGDAPHAVDYLRSHSVDEIAGDARDKASEMAGDARDKADEVASTVREKADEVSTQASAKVNDAISGTGQQVSNLGHAIRKRTAKNWADKATNATADALESSGHYLQEQDVEGMRSGLKKMICRHPIASLLLSAGISFMLGRKIFR